MSDPDIDLMLRIQAGDERAFRDVFDRYSPALLSFFQWYGLPFDEAEDAVQEVFQRVWLARDMYTPTGRFRSYLYRIAANLTIDRGRAMRRRPATMSLDAPIDDGTVLTGSLMERIPGPSSLPAARLELEETASRIEEAIAQLPEGQRVVFLLGVREELRYSEISGILGIPEGTVKSRMHAAVHRLRDLLSKERGFR